MFIVCAKMVAEGELKDLALQRKKIMETAKETKYC